MRGFRGALAVGLVLLGVLETAWLGWYLVEPMPSAEGARTTLPGGKEKVEPMRRWYLLAEAIPYFVYGSEWEDSLVVGAVEKLATVRYLPQRVPVAGAGLLILAGGVGLGLLVLRGVGVSGRLSGLERVGLSFGVGLNGLSTVVLGAGKLGWLSGWVFWPMLVGLAVGGIGVEVARRSRDRERKADKWDWKAVAGFVVVAGPFLILMVLGSMQPTVEFDSLEYHLEGPKEWYLAGRITFLRHNVYTTMPFSVEMLHLLGMEVYGDWWKGALVGQFVVMAHELAAALMIGLAAGRWGSKRAAWVAAVVYLGTPWAYRLSVFPFVEGPLIYYHAALVWVVARVWGEDRGAFGNGLWLIAGWLAGGAMACKYPGMISAVVPAGVVVLVDGVRKREWRAIGAFVLGVAVAVGPWLVKNLIEHRNPVYPLGYSVLGGEPWSAEREAKWQKAHGPKPMTWGYLVAGVLDVAGRNDCQSALYTALVPLAFWRREWRKFALGLFGYAVYLFATWWLLTHRLDRFYLPILAPLAVLAGLGADWCRRTGWTVMLAVVMGVGLFTSWVYDISALAALNEWTEDLAVLRENVPRRASPTLTWVDQNLPPGSKVLLIGQAGVFHLRVEKIYNTVFDEEVFEEVAKGRSAEEVGEELRRRGVTHVLVDWTQIERHRKPGGYGFSEFITPELFAGLESAGVLEPVKGPGAGVEVYRVVGGAGRGFTQRRGHGREG